MSKKDNIITDAEEDFNEELDGNFNPSILCDGDTCRHSECECWDSFRLAVEQQLQKQIDERNAEMASMYSLYKAEVKYGIHIPRGKIQDELDTAV